MCVIAISQKGNRIPTEDEFYTMWKHNPHGAGYMFARGGKVTIHKGFLVFDDFIRSARSEKFTESDSVVFHFRISTQGGINPGLTHPFPLTSNLDIMKALDINMKCIGIAHNGIIPITSDRYDKENSDTTLFIANYLPRIIRNVSDLSSDVTRIMIETLCPGSKFAFMDAFGNITMIGKFTEQDGILLSNTSHLYTWDFSKKYNSICNF